jgi:hypothetical protein
MTALEIRLPTADGTIAPYRLVHDGAPRVRVKRTPPRSRVAYAAAHVVANPLAGDPLLDSRIDWDATLAYRHHLWSLGFGVAEAMDTAQRGMGITGAQVRELIDRSLREAASVGGLIACGIATDGLEGAHDLHAIIDAYCEQLAFVEDRGGRAVVMASRALAASARGAEDYVTVYDAVLGAAQRPVIIHWLGEMFDPKLAGYWGSTDRQRATAEVIDLLECHAARIDGIKVSLLDEAHEVALRRKLPPGVRMYTGDDYNFPQLIQGDEYGYSDALLGIFDAIAPVAAEAFTALDAGDASGFRRALEPTVPFSRHVFGTPTYAYKTGIVFLAYLNEHQNHFRMIGGLESARSIAHLAELFRLADAAGLLDDPERALARMQATLALAGV